MGNNKYHAKLTEVDGIQFHSRREATRYSELKIFQHAGMIQKLELQVKYPLVVNGLLVCTYIADFRYLDLAAGGGEVIEDSKGVRTRDYKIKKKLMRALHGIVIHEV